MGCLIYGAIVLGLARAHVPVGVIIHDSKQVSKNYFIFIV